ncbi:3-phosphoshikimate 1-carboxyvinyltransferase [Candidatus Bathyarchaeota archaeon]|nr:3-phosphoshikimate 1-carboxyvinyltransferase [Candidatus Bathyarchaeota archaeon]
MDNPEFITIPQCSAPFEKHLQLPGSKSITNRALITAALAGDESKLSNVLFSDDTRYMMEALNQLGIKVVKFPRSHEVKIHGSGGNLDCPNRRIYVGNSGTCMRFLTSVACLGNGTYLLDGDERMRERPIQDLIDGLQSIGVSLHSVQGNGCPPVRIHASGLPGGEIEMRGTTSSQYFSSIMLAAPLARERIVLKVIGDLVSRPYVAMTASIMAQFGARAHFPEKQTIRVDPGSYISKDYAIESDFSAASYFMAAAACTSSKITLTHLPKDSIQGDSVFIDIIRKMGSKVFQAEDGIEITGTEVLHPVDVDLYDCSDLLPTIAVLALFAEGKTRIRNVENVRVKETDRLNALNVEIKKLGGNVVEFRDGLEIIGKKPSEYNGALIHTYNDHRMAMAFSVAGLLVPGIRIANPSCTAKTYPKFFDDFLSLVT